MSACPSETTVIAFIAGDADQAACARVEAHMAACAECRVLISELVRDPLATSKPVAHALPEADEAALAGARAEPFQPHEAQRLESRVGRSGRVGAIVAGKYRIDEVLGAGGMGVVVAATHIELGKAVALKFLRAGHTATRGARARFLREGRAAAALLGEHIAHVTDFGTLEDGVAYLVMERLVGLDFAALLEREGRLPTDVAVDYVLQACEAVAEAHTHGIVHRDLKPANLFLATRPDGSALVKVLDFGISKMARPELDSEWNGALQATTTGDLVVGSPRYMSPEQMLSPRDVDARADVWALGVILFELLTGKSPFDASSAAGLCGTILTVNAPDVRTLRADVPDRLAKTIASCLTRDRDERLASVGSLAAALAVVAPPRSQVSIDRIARMTSAESRVGAGAKRDETKTQMRARIPSRAALAAAAAIGITMAMAGAFVHRTASAAGATPAEPRPTENAAVASQPEAAIGMPNSRPNEATNMRSGGAPGDLPQLSNTRPTEQPTPVLTAAGHIVTASERPKRPLEVTRPTMAFTSKAATRAVGTPEATEAIATPAPPEQNEVPVTRRSGLLERK